MKKNKAEIVSKDVIETLRKIRYVKSMNIHGKKNSKNAFYNVYDAASQMDVIFEAQKCGLVYFYELFRSYYLTDYAISIINSTEFPYPIFLHP
jgi:hypothetical protein